MLQFDIERDSTDQPAWMSQNHIDLTNGTGVEKREKANKSEQTQTELQSSFSATKWNLPLMTNVHNKNRSQLVQQIMSDWWKISLQTVFPRNGSSIARNGIWLSGWCTEGGVPHVLRICSVSNSANKHDYTLIDVLQIWKIIHIQTMLSSMKIQRFIVLFQLMIKQ